MAARRRETNRWDAVINGVNYRLKRQEGAYRKVSGRSQLEVQQMLNQAGNQFTSRRDLRTLFQTDWSGGAQWQKPLLSDQSIDTYYTSTGFDLITEPGNIIPQPDYQEVSSIDTHYLPFEEPAIVVQVSPTEIYASGAGANVAKWNGTTGSTLSNTFGHSDPVDMCWDSANATLYGLSASYVDYVTPDTAGGTVIAHGETLYAGASILMHFGRLLVWTGSKLLEISDPLGTPSVSTIYDDQMGPDAVDDITAASAFGIFHQDLIRLAAATSEGVYIVKNVYQRGTIVPFISRVDRTNDGTNVGVPVGTLPRGTVALSVTYQLGSLVVAASTDLQKTFKNNSSTGGIPVMTFFHLTNDSLGTIGSPLGGFSPASAPYNFIGSENGLVYIGGRGGTWVWDSVRGGLHLHRPQGGEAAMASSTDNSGNKIQMFFAGYGSTSAQTWYPVKDEGGATYGHTLESNYIDGNLPAELKSLVGITLMTSGIKTGETWTVTVEADDGSFVSAATFNTVGAKTSYKALASAITGYRFRYKLAWTATGDITSPSRVKGIVLHMVQGEMVTAWQLTIDGTEMRSVENTVLRPEDALSDLETLMDKQTMTTFVDEMRVTSSTHDVRVDSVQVSRSSPSEIEEAVVVLTEQDLDN